MTRFDGKLVISSIFEGFVACLAAPPGAVGARRLSGLCRPVAPCGGLKIRVGTPIERIADIDAWRPEASMPGWPGWLAWLAGWLGWLAWLAGLAWLDERMRKVSHARRSEEVGGFYG